jgi:hypothetical protein
MMFLYFLLLVTALGTPSELAESIIGLFVPSSDPVDSSWTEEYDRTDLLLGTGYFSAERGTYPSHLVGPSVTKAPSILDVTPQGYMEPISIISNGFESNIVGTRFINRDESSEERPSKRQRITDTEVVVKYVNDCKSRIHKAIQRPDLKEYAMYFALNSTGLVPITHYISPPSVLVKGDPRTEVVTDFLKNHWEKCIELGTEVRFMVFEKLGLTLTKYFQEARRVSWPNNYIKKVLIVARKVLNMLHQMHKMGIVHGDIHGRNIMLKQDNPMDPDVRFIDFELAVFYPMEFGERVVVGRSSLNEFLLSPWHIEGNRLGRRDDLFRWIELTARSLNANLLGAYKASINKGYEAQDNPPEKRVYISQELSSIKRTENLFGVSAYLGTRCCQGFPGVADRLDEIVTLIRAVPHPDSEPDYTRISELLESALAEIL